MIKKYKTWIAIFTAIIAIGGLLTFAIPTEAPAIAEAETISTLTHAQETWISALEWCESRGDPNAINEVDLDGTASYYSFQFKPSTFKTLSIQYGILPAGLEDEDYFNYMSITEYQRKVVESMVEDPATQWERQFPGCVRILGRPPKG